MEIMNMPGFTAEESLYGASGHYRSDRNRTGINLTAQANVTIHPEATDLDTLGEEVIIIEGTAPTPWGLPFGWGSGGWGGHFTGPGMPLPSGPSGGGGKGGGGKTPTKKPLKVSEGCTVKQLGSKGARRCLDLQPGDLDRGENPHFVRCKGSKISCCQSSGTGSDRVTICDDL